MYVKPEKPKFNEKGRIIIRIDISFLFQKKFIDYGNIETSPPFK